MSAEAAYVEKRRFGRKPSNIRGRATIPGQPARSFTIWDFSEGGAQLAFDHTIAHPRSMRIEIDGTTFVLTCDVCHQGKHGVGVKFVRRAEAVASYRHFEIKPVESCKEQRVAPRALIIASTTVRMQDLRVALRMPPADRTPASQPTPAAV